VLLVDHSMCIGSAAGAPIYPTGSALRSDLAKVWAEVE
jgi:hypothetical protein